MGNPEWADILVYCYNSVLAFGILGNILVIISILRQNKLLKKNYYFIVLQLAICDLGWCAMDSLHHINFLVRAVIYSKAYCLVFSILLVSLFAGIYMMLVIAVLRYRATVHPLKPDISRKKLKIVCGLGYILGLIVGYGLHVLDCFRFFDHDAAWFWYFHGGYFACLFLFPTVFMAVVYYKIGRALIKQNKHMKRVCSNAVRSRYVQNRRTFLVCLGTVLCFGVSTVPYTVFFPMGFIGGHRLPANVVNLFYVLRIAGSHAINPLIYGIFDKKLLAFWKRCSSRK